MCTPDEQIEISFWVLREACSLAVMLRTIGRLMEIWLGMLCKGQPRAYTGACHVVDLQQSLGYCCGLGRGQLAVSGGNQVDCAEKHPAVQYVVVTVCALVGIMYGVGRADCMHTTSRFDHRIKQLLSTI